jgi:cytochrome c oxidase subunit 2
MRVTELIHGLLRMAKVVGLLLPVSLCFGVPGDRRQLTSIFSPDSTPAHSIFGLSIFVLAITAVIFVVVFVLIAYSVIRFRASEADDRREPPQVYGSTQIELAWTVIPIMIVLVLFLASGRIIAEIQDAQKPRDAIDITVVGHQFGWEFRYPGLNVVTANEMHVPVSDPAHPTPTYLTLLSADTDHSFWVPRLAGKTDLIPNHPNRMWIDPHKTGLYLGHVAHVVSAHPVIDMGGHCELVR